MPALRKTLIQLLTELEFSGAERSKEESARLLGHLIRTSRNLVTPYVSPVLKALLPKLHSGGGTLASSVLATLGELSEVGAWHITPHLQELLPLIINTLQRQAGVERQEVAVRTLGQLVKNTGFVIDPYEQHPELLTTLLSILNAGAAVPWRFREEVLRTLGTLGALDPYVTRQSVRFYYVCCCCVVGVVVAVWLWLACLLARVLACSRARVLVASCVRAR